MDNVTLITIVTLFGAASGTIIPYIIKAWQDPTIIFDFNYAYALLIGIVLQIATLIPDSVPIITIKVLILAFAAGYGIQTLINKAVPTKELPINSKVS